MNVVAVNIKNIRLNRGLTQEQFAKQLGISNQAISAYESGTRTPKMKFIIKVAEYYGLTIADILESKPADTELQLLEKFRRLSEADKSEVIDIIDLKLRRNK